MIVYLYNEVIVALAYKYKCMRNHFDFDISTQLYIIYILLQMFLFKNKFYFILFNI